MKTIEISIKGKTFQARLLEERAPETCEAIWNAMPFTSRGVHALWSGNLVHTVDPVPVSVEKTEDPTGFQYPGLIAYHPGSNEFAFTYDDARFRGSARAEYVTPVAEILGDVNAFGEVAATLQWEGAAEIEFKQGSDAAEIAPQPSPNGTQIELNLEGVIATATLLEDFAPRTCEAFLKLLPLDGPVTNTKWSGDMAHFWGPDRPARGPIGLKVDPVENPTLFHWPGYIYYHPTYSGIRFSYGDAQQGGAFTISKMSALAKFNDDWTEFQNVVKQIYMTGQKQMQIRVKE